MAEEKITIPANSDEIEVKSNHTRRNSTGNLHISKEGLKILPRYLRASLGSCHDFCKYGVVDSLEKKPRSNKLQIKPKALPDSESPTNHKHHQVTKKEDQVSAKKVAVSSKRFSLHGNITDVCAERNSYINASKEMKLPKSRKKEDFVPPAVERELSAKSGNRDPETTLYVIETKPQHQTENVIDATPLCKSLSPSFEDKKFECHRNGVHSSRSPPSSENKQLRHSRNGVHATRPSSPSFLSAYENGLRRTQNGNHNTPPSLPSSEIVESDPFSGSTIEPKMVGIASLDDEIGSHEKISFSRGKVDNVLSKNTSPRKLSFKERRVLCENQNGKADSEPISLKELVAVDDLSGSETEPTKVVLKHRDVEKKERDQNLFNNVIEETASKLVQTRKSKVWALVDAFETVISLQDTKSSATTNVYRAS